MVSWKTEQEVRKQLVRIKKCTSRRNFTCIIIKAIMWIANGKICVNSAFWIRFCVGSHKITHGKNFIALLKRIYCTQAYWTGPHDVTSQSIPFLQSRSHDGEQKMHITFTETSPNVCSSMIMPVAWKTILKWMTSEKVDSVVIWNCIKLVLSSETRHVSYFMFW